MAKPEETEIIRIIKFILGHKIPMEQLKELLDSGILGSLLLTPPSNINLDKFYEAIGPRLMGYIPIALDPNQTAEQLIASGNYKFKNSDINSENFPATNFQSENLNVLIICFKRPMSSEEVLQSFKKLGLHPAKLIHLLNVGKDFPDYQLQYPIVALGSTWKSPAGFLYVPFLFAKDKDRYADLAFFKRKWSPQCWFLAVQK